MNNPAKKYTGVINCTVPTLMPTMKVAQSFTVSRPVSSLVINVLSVNGKRICCPDALNRSAD